MTELSLNMCCLIHVKLSLPKGIQAKIILPGIKKVIVTGNNLWVLKNNRYLMLRRDRLLLDPIDPLKVQGNTTER
jgi:hypothetical protein